MIEFLYALSGSLGGGYEWFRALHIIAVIAWMAGLFYLPRLFVYHCGAEKDSDAYKTFITMEKKLYKIIMNPAMIASWLFGILVLLCNLSVFEKPWFHAKLLAVVILTIMHFIYGKWQRDFEKGLNTKSHVFYRYMNEVPTILMIIIVIMGVVEPF